MDIDEKKRMISKFTFILLVSILLAVFITFNATYYFLVEANKLSKVEYSENAVENISAISANLKNIRKKINQNFIGEINEERVLDEAIKGYVKGLDDEYSQYMTADEWEQYKLMALGNYVGIGIYMSLDKNGYIVIVTPIENTPASEAGLKSEDIIVEIDGESAVGLTTEEASTKIKGIEGTKVALKILRDNEYIDYEIERKEIKVYHVSKEMLEGNIGYILLRAFDEGCSQEFKTAYEELVNMGATKIILDLRYNTGGLVEEALSIADAIIPKGETLLVTVDSRGNKQTNKAKMDDSIELDMVVLVNEYTASASEILAGALKDNKKATLVGTKTYGKGVIQSVFPLDDGSILKLTTNEYFTPNETKINKQGIEPDYIIEIEEKRR